MSVHFAETEWRSFDVEGDSLADVAAVVSRMDEAGRTEWFPSYEYETTGGVLVSAAVTVRIRMTMPRWSRCSSAPRTEQEEWTRFCRALQAHEQGHLALVVEHLSDIDERLIGSSEAAARRVWHRTLAKLDAASRAYDRATDHGRKHGTVIDVGVGTQ